MEAVGLTVWIPKSVFDELEPVEKRKRGREREGGGREGGRDRRNRKNWELGVREASHTHESSARREEGCPRPVSGPACPESACHPHHGKEEEDSGKG